MDFLTIEVKEICVIVLSFASYCEMFHLHKERIIIFLLSLKNFWSTFALMQIGNPQDYEKKIKPGPKLPDSYRDRAGQRTWTVFIIWSHITYRTDRTKILFRGIRNSWRRCPDACSIYRR